MPYTGIDAHKQLYERVQVGLSNDMQIDTIGVQLSLQ